MQIFNITIISDNTISFSQSFSRYLEHFEDLLNNPLEDDEDSIDNQSTDTLDSVRVEPVYDYPRDDSIPEPPSTDDDFWNSPSWKCIPSTLPNLQRFIKIFNSSHANNPIKFIKENFEINQEEFAIKHYQPPNFNNVDSICLQKCREDSHSSSIYEGQAISVKCMDPNNLTLFDNCNLPSYTISELPLPKYGDSCGACHRKITGNLCDINCKSCGILLCSGCRCNSPIFHLGFNKSQDICHPCLQKSQEMDCLLWIRKSRHAMECGENESARLFLYISYLYSKKLTTQTQINAVKIEARSLEKSALTPEIMDYKTIRLLKLFEGVKGFDWVDLAEDYAKNGHFKLALACLDSANLNLLKEVWEDIAQRFLPYHPVLPLFCHKQYIRSQKEWISQAIFYNSLIIKNQDDANQEKDFCSLAYLCIKEAHNSTTSGKQKKMHNELIKMEEYRLAIYALKVANASKKEIISVFQDHCKSDKNNFPAMVISKLILAIFSKQKIRNLQLEDPFFRFMWQIRDCSSMTEMKLIDCIDKAEDIGMILVPLALLKGKASFSCWTQLSLRAKRLEPPRIHASLIFSHLQ